ncbi:hypothetical protein [Ascidiimonas sp. W6]|uniref:hypothetical protein n=1 Tax=Ascidiimonas meishanensis TaxID=3128903 RepID=UPI0030EB8317
MSISKMIPNPFDKNSTLSGLEKKKELIKEGLSFIGLIKMMAFLGFFGFILIVYFKISTTVITILIGTEILVNLIVGYLKIKAMKSIYSIDTQDSAKSYRNLLIINEYWDFIKSVLHLIGISISSTLIFVFLSSEGSDLIGQLITPYSPIKGESWKYILFVFIIFRAYKFMIHLIKYYWIENLSKSDNFAKINQEYVLIEKKLSLIRLVPTISIGILVMFWIGLTHVFSWIIAVFMLIVVVLSIIEFKRIKNVQFDDNRIDPSTVQHKIENRQDEQIEGAVFGIIETVTSFKDIFKNRGGAFLGAGKSRFPENSLVITNYRLLLVQIPVSGGNKMIGGTDYASHNFHFNRGEIRQKGEQLLKTNSVPEFLELTTNDIYYRDIKTVTLHHTNIIIKKLSEDKLGYFFMDEEYIEPLKELLKLHLKEKFIEK